MSELVDIIHHVYAYGGYHIRRARGRMEDYCGCVHCRGLGEEYGVRTMFLYRASDGHSSDYPGVPIVQRGPWRCCVCRGLGYLPVPQAGEELPPACG